MTSKSLPSVLTSLGSGHGSSEPDVELLERFLDTHDESAFRELVRRYARLVWRVARTRCRTDATAEDVFQAAFVVLSRKGSSIRSGVAVAGWLHRTAHRLAVKAAKKERQAVPLPDQIPASADPLDALSARELLTVVDDELAKLSDVERSVLVLCGIDGLANDDAAQRLGWSPGALKGRLERARAKLRTRLDARGLTIPAVLIALIGNSPNASAIQAAFAIPGGAAQTPGVEQLIAEGVAMSGIIPKAIGVLVLCGAFGLIGGFTGTSPAPQVHAAPVPKKAEQEKLIVWSQPLRAETGFTATHGIWTPDGKYVLTGGQVPGAKGGEWPGELRVWDAGTGKLVHTHRGELSYATRPTTVAITADGKMLAVAGYGNTQPRQFTLDLFDWGEEKPRASLKVNKPVSGVRFSADGKTIYTIDMRGDLAARDVKTEKLLWTTALGNELTWAMANWNNGKELLVADEGGTVSRFDAATGRMLPPLGKFDITPLSLSVTPDEKWVALGGYGGKTPIAIDCKDQLAGEFRSMKFTDPKVQANQVSLSPDVKHLAAACTDGTVKVCDAASGDLIAERKEHTGILGGVQYSPDGKRLLTVGSDAIKVWNVAELMKPTTDTPDPRKKNAPVPKASDGRWIVWSEPLKDGKRDELRVVDGIWSPDGKSLITGSYSQLSRNEWKYELLAWDGETGKLRHTFRGDLTYLARPHAMAISPDGKTVAVLGHNNGGGPIQKIDLFDWGKESPQSSVVVNNSTSYLAFAPDGSVIVTLDIDSVRAWDWKSGKQVWATKLGRSYFHIGSIGFWNGGQEVLVPDGERSVLRFETSTGKVLTPFRFAADIPLTTDKNVNRSAKLGTAKGDTCLAIQHEKELPFLLSFKNGEVAQTKQIEFDANVQSICGTLSPDGKYYAVAGSDNTVRVFNTTTCKQVVKKNILAYHIAYSPDGKRLLTVGQDAIKVWDADELMKPK